MINKTANLILYFIPDESERLQKSTLCIGTKQGLPACLFSAPECMSQYKKIMLDRLNDQLEVPLWPVSIAVV